MTRILARFTRRIAPLLLAFGLVFTPTMTTIVHAQEEAAPAVPGEGSGRPLDGYLGTICLVLFALFVVGKSARR